MRKIVAILACLAGLLLTVGVSAPANADPAAPPRLSSSGEGKPLGTYSPLTAIPTSAEVVKVGIYPINVYDIDFKANTYRMTAYVWLKWKGDLDPTASMEFTNLVEEWGLMLTPLYDDTQTIDETGESYQVMRLNGQFYAPYDLRDYPLDKQKLTIDLEDSDSGYRDIVYTIDQDATGLDANITVPGWRLTGWSADTLVHDYKTSFGDPAATAETNQYSVLRFSVNMTRHANFFIWKLLFPLVVVLLTCWLALLLKPRWVDLRTGMPATALLTVVFLQISYADSLPQVSDLVLMDKIYVLVYGLILATLVQIVWGNRTMDHDDDASHARVQRMNLISVVVQAVAFVVILSALIALR